MRRMRRELGSVQGMMAWATMLLMTIQWQVLFGWMNQQQHGVRQSSPLV